MKINDITEGVLSDIYGAYTQAKRKPSPVADAPEYEIPDDVGLDPSTMAKAQEYSHAADKRAYLSRARSQAEIEKMREDWESNSPRFKAFSDQIGGRILAPELPSVPLKSRFAKRPS